MSTPGSSSEEPQLVFQRIGAGSFATVYALSGTRIAYKQVQGKNDGDTLRAEFEALCKIYMPCNSDSFFILPRPIAFYNPVDDIFLAHHPPPANNARRRGPQAVTRRGELVKFDTATYSMERIHPLPLSLASTIAATFYPPQHRTQPGPKLCRLYFGKTIDDARPLRFFNSNNFPLDIARYTMLRESEPLDPVGDVAYGMGEMLGRIHWRGGYDARDIEFVLGGDGYYDPTFHVIDFNQMRSWSKTLDDISVLADAHFSNDPYFPRARPTEPLYLDFRKGYLDAYPQHEECQTIAKNFLEEIEKRQSARDGSSVGEA